VIRSLNSYVPSTKYPYSKRSLALKAKPEVRPLVFDVTSVLSLMITEKTKVEKSYGRQKKIVSGNLRGIGDPVIMLWILCQKTNY
jgi:hypothetical protein